MMPVWDSTFQLVLLGAVLIGGTSGVLGTFAVLRKRSLLGDALAHAALPGVAIAFMLTESKALPILLTGATLSGVVGVLLIQLIVNHTRIKADAALGIVLSVFFGGGIVLLTHIQQTAVGNQSGLDKFLFGQAASIVASDLYAMACMVFVVMVVVILFFKEFSALIFDPGFLGAIGFAPRWVDLLLMSLIVLTVMVGLQAVGVILVAAMLITPAVSARFWTNDLIKMVFISGLVGCVAGGSGAWISALAPRIPTGPVMVLVATGIFVISALVAPQRGVIARLMRHRQNQSRERAQHFLRACVELQELAGQVQTICSLADLSQAMQEPLYRVRRLAKNLSKTGQAILQDDIVELTPKGFEDGLFVLKSHRLWEYYLVYRSILEEDHVDRPADEVEHILTPDIMRRLEVILAEENIDVENVTSIHATASGFRKAGQDA